MGQGQQPAQRGGPPKNDTPYILITTFHSNDRQLGVQMGDELRKRVQQEHNAQELYAVPKNSINGTLEASGYRPDSALSASDLMELSKQLRGEEVIEGTINKGGTGLIAEARVLVKANQTTLVQPLPKVDAKDVGDAAKQLERAITESNKALGNYKTCKNSLIAAKYPEAMTAARAGIAAYPSSTLNRLCLMNAMSLSKAPADSIIAVATAIRSMDPTSMIALSNLAEAYLAKGDTAKAIETNLAIYRLDPSNPSIGQSIVQMLANSGAPEQAIPIIDSLLVNNPGDPAMLHQKWLLQLRAKQFKAALASGEEYVKADTAGANLDYFQRQIGAAQSDSNNAAVMQLAGRAGQKFPKEVIFQTIVARGNLVAGQLQPALAAARRAQAIDPKNSAGWLIAMSAFNQLNMPDSVLATAQKAIAAGVPKDEIGASLLAVVGPALKKAQETKAREDWQATLKAAETVDAIAPSPQSAFYIGVSAFTIAGDILTDVQKLAKSTKKADKDQACADAKEADDMLSKVAIAMPKGGSVNKEAATQILTNMPNLSDFVAQVKKAYCK